MSDAPTNMLVVSDEGRVDLNVGQLKKALERVPDDAQICLAVLGHYAAPRQVIVCVKDNAIIIQ